MVLYASRSSTSWLSYEVSVIPRFNFPAIFLERIIRSDLPVNLQALAFRAERNFEGTQKLKMMVNSPSRKSTSGVASIVTDIRDSLLKEKKVLPTDIIKEGVLSPSGAVAEVNTNWGVFGKVCRLDKPCVVDEVHLRRLDGLLVSYSSSVSACWNVTLFPLILMTYLYVERKMAGFIAVWWLALLWKHQFGKYGAFWLPMRVSPSM